MTSIIVTSIICATIITLAILSIKYKDICIHKWEKVDEEKMWPKDHPTGPDDQHYSHRWVILQCKKCGKIYKLQIW